MAPKVTLYEKIIQDMLKDIHEGRLKPGDRIPTEAELGEKYKVSRITVIRALKELEMRGLLKRVKKKGTFIKEAEAPETDRVHIPAISVVLPFSEEFGYDILRGVENVCAERGYYVTFHNSKYEPQRERDILEKIVADNLAGAIIYPSAGNHNIDIYSRMIMSRFPFVLIDRTVKGVAAPLVVSNNIQAGYELTRHLTALGHKKIAFVCTSVNEALSVSDRYRGYCNALISEGIVPLPEWLIEDNARLEDINSEDVSLRLKINQQRLERVLALPDPPTAIVAVNDETAMKLIKAAQLRGIAIPDQLSITGFDNLSAGELFDVPLTTIKQDFTGIGAQAARLVIELQEGTDNHKAVPERITLETELVVRKSTVKV
ncbi:GntR family transcriptional regulator [Paenibacillus sp. S150]|uniref:GntR family transcriptional regulator n=1 Tax=Paenibacillus sp. S150 TaxID=2749826 RepID=UPI001C55A262|nr:GntR family transcriptional regulator [Paenibacillus sp. S150]MBW4079883.1 GntR family transcriptional regulator [Paenibacillus sp. S150]